MMNIRAANPDALQFEALLNARAYLYEMFYHLTGGVPTVDLLGMLSSETVQNVLDEYEDIEEIIHLARLFSLYAKMDEGEAEGFVNRAKDEYTRVFIGPASLPASPYESPYRGTHDMSLLQENTLAVRQAYRSGGFEPKKISAIPDDHVAFMCSFMAKRAIDALHMYEFDGRQTLSMELIGQSEFVNAHMAGWLDVFAESVATSGAASANVLYPTLLKALGAFVKADSSFLLEGVAWLNEESASGAERIDNAIEAEYVTDMLEKAESAFREVKESLAMLQDIEQLGLTDYLLVRI